jgi:adenylylsulfate kinase-like enzyme
MIVWIIGLSGAGKSTIAAELYAQWKPHAPNLVLLDGDALREVFAHTGEGAYTPEGRRVNAQRMRALCRLLDAQNIHVICPILSIFEEDRAANRAEYSGYFEVYIEATLAEVSARDNKRLYAAARGGSMPNVVGLDIPFTPPARPDMVIRNGTPPVDASAAAQSIMQCIGVA